MSRFSLRYYVLLWYMVVCAMAVPAMAQHITTVRGIVLDSLYNVPLAHVAVVAEGAEPVGCVSDENGVFDMTVYKAVSQVRFSLLGYNDVVVQVREGDVNEYRVLMSSQAVMLDEVLVKRTKERYSKKNNPAVDFARQVIAHRDEGSVYDAPYFFERKYEKITFALDDFDKSMLANPLFKDMQYLAAYIDKSDVTHKPILNLAIRERVIDAYWRKEPERRREVVTGINRAGLKGLIDQDNMQALSNEMFREVDLYSNDIELFGQQFVSPLSEYAVSFYKYYLLDTLEIDGVECIDLGFASYNSQSFGFAGHLYVVAGDSSCFVKRARYTIPQDINMNYVSRMILQQDYERDSRGNRVKVYDDIVAEFRMAEGLAGMYARRTVHYKDFSYEPPVDEDVFGSGQREVTLAGAMERDSRFWEQHRAYPLRMQEDAIGEVSLKLQELPAVKWGVKAMRTLFSGYIATHPHDDESRFDIGPINTLVSGNSIEGVRLRVGGTTTARLFPRLFASGDVAYGFDDNKWKYGASLEYSFNDKKHSALEYPIRSVKAYYQYDLNYLAQKYLHTSRDNFVLSLRRAPDYNATYMRTCGVTFKYEFAGGLSLDVGVRNELQESTQYLPFTVRDAQGAYRSLPSFMQTMGEVCLRYQPAERFLTSYGEREALGSDAPVISLRHIFAIKGLWSDYTYNHTELAVSKRIRMSKLGYADVIVKAGKVWNDVPYPLLIIPYANMSYTIQPESYSLLSPMEFIFDQYASWDITYFANGLLLNRIPYINSLRLREVISFRGIYGTIRDTNYYPGQTGLFMFNPQWNVQRMTNMPYMEVGVGIDNILSILRVEYVFRATYRDTPGVDRGGVRVALHVSF